MGAWGDESCSNDTCWDALGTHGVKDIHNMQEDEAHQALTMFVTFMSAWTAETKETHLGMVVWVLRHGLGVEHVHLRLALDHAADFRDDVAYLGRWRDPASRRAQLDIEIKDISNAMKDLPVGKRGRIEAREIKGLCSRIADATITDAQVVGGAVKDDPNLEGTISMSEAEMNRSCFMSIKEDSTELYFHDMQGETLLTISRSDGTVTWNGPISDAAKVFVAAVEKMLQGRIVKN